MTPIKHITQIKAVKDESGHWYVIPLEREEEFYNDHDDVELIYSGQFDNKWGTYRTGGDLNNIQLYAYL
jgi:hypothetical protein